MTILRIKDGMHDLTLSNEGVSRAVFDEYARFLRCYA